MCYNVLGLKAKLLSTKNCNMKYCKIVYIYWALFFFLWIDKMDIGLNYCTLVSVSNTHNTHIFLKGRRGAVGCTSDSSCGGRGFEPNQRPPLFP